MAKMISKRAALRRRLTSLREVQAIYMPCVPLLLARHIRTMRIAAPDQRALDLPEEQPSFFPSQVPCEMLDMCTPGLACVEERLRDCQMRHCLEKIRIQLQVKDRLITFKNRHVRHQGPNTRARRKIELNEAKIAALADKYRAAWDAKLALCGGGSWQNEWKVLARADVRTLTSPGDTNDVEGDGASSTTCLVSEGRRKISWIWMAADKGDQEESVQVEMQDGELTYLSTIVR